MTLVPENDTLTRRALLRGAAMGTAGLLLPRFVTAQDAPKSDKGSPYYPWRMGIQSYSLRHFKTEEMLAKTAALGLKYVEAYPEHFPLTDDPKVIASYKEQLATHKIIMPAYGVVYFSASEPEIRKYFAFARAMGLETLTASPPPDSFDILDKLVKEYNIRIAIHNHGPGDRYDKMDKVFAAIQGHDSRIGACVDTGHYLRSDESPVSAVGKFKDRLYDVHLKNVKMGPNQTKEFTEIGELGGLLDVVGMLRTMKRNHFAGLMALEYEEHEDDPVPFIEKCLAATRRSIDTVNHYGIPTDK